MHIIPVNNNGSTAQYRIVESYGGSTGGYALRYDEGTYDFYKLNSGSDYDLLQSSHHPEHTGPINHVAASYNASNNEMKIYVDGILEGSMVTSMTETIQQSNMYIGGLGDNGAVTRDTGIDDVRIWGVVKTQTEIQNSLNSCLTGHEQDLLAHYTFDNSNTSSVIDNTGNGNDGTIGSFNESSSFTSGILECCTVNIPDASFKAYLVSNTAINTNGDTEIQCDEASAFTGAIYIGGYFISDLTGIEAFTSITTLQCYNNQLTSIDLTSNIALTELRCQNNQLTSLNVANGNNTNFIYFIVSNNPNLSCIQVDDATYSTTNWMDIDAGASFNEDCSGTVGLFDSHIEEDLDIYPNPTSSQLTIDNLSLSEVNIIDISGKVVKTANTNEIDVASLPNGMYILKIQSSTGLIYSRFVKE